MSMKKIIACTAASVVAASALAVAASAVTITSDAVVDGQGSYTFGYVDAWYDLKLIDDANPGVISGLLGEGVDPADVESITFTTEGDGKWMVCYDGVEGWTQPDDDFFNASKAGDVVTLNASDINWEKENLCVKVGINAADEDTGADFVLKWTVNMKDAGTDAPADTDTTTDTTTNVDTGVEGVAAVLGVAAVAAGAMIVAKKRK